MSCYEGTAGINDDKCDIISLTDQCVIDVSLVLLRNSIDSTLSEKTCKLIFHLTPVAFYTQNNKSICTKETCHGN